MIAGVSGYVVNGYSTGLEKTYHVKMLESFISPFKQSLSGLETIFDRRVKFQVDTLFIVRRGRVNGNGN